MFVLPWIFVDAIMFTGVAFIRRLLHGSVSHCKQLIEHVATLSGCCTSRIRARVSIPFVRLRDVPFLPSRHQTIIEQLRRTLRSIRMIVDQLSEEGPSRGVRDQRFVGEARRTQARN